MPPQPAKPAPNLLPAIIGLSGIYAFVAWKLFSSPSLMASYVCVILISLRSSRPWHPYFAAALGSMILIVQMYLHALGPLGLQAKLLLGALVISTLWGAALLGSRTVYRTRRETAQLTEQTVSTLQAERLQAATEGSNIWLWETDHTGRRVWDLNPPAVLGLEALPDAATRWQTCLAHMDPQDLAHAGTQLDAAIRHRAPQITQRFKITAPDGQWVLHLLTRGRIYYSDDGQALRILGATTDVTEEVHRSEQLQAQVQIQQMLNHRVKLAAHAAGLWIWERDPNTREFVWDENRPTEFGHDGPLDAEFLKTLGRLIVDEDLKMLEEIVKRAIDNHAAVYTLRYRTRHPGSGLIRHRESIGNILYDDHNKPLKLIGITRDVTNEVQTHEMIQREARVKDELSSRLNAAIETAGMHCWQLSFPGPELVWSQNAAAELGAQTSELPLPQLQQILLGGIHPDDVAEFTTHTDAALQQGVKTRTFRYRRHMPDGSLQIFRAYHHYHCHDDQTPPYVIGACINITQQVETSEQLRRQKEELEQLHMRIERAALSSQEGHWEIDLQSGAHWVSASYRALLGYTADFDLGTIERFHAIVHPEDRAEIERVDIASVTFGGLFINTSRMLHASGEWRWMQSRGAVERDGDGHPVRFTGSMRDIHEQKIAEEKLLEAQQRFSRAVSGTADGLWEADLSKGSLWLSPRFMAILGFEAIESTLSAADLDAWIHPDDLESAKEQRQRAYALDIPLDFEHRILNSNQDWIWVRVRGTVQRDATGKPIRMAGSMSNVTTEHQAHEELVRATEAAQEANLAKSAFLANMSHEIRTPMNGIIGMTGLMLDTELDPMQREFADTIRSSADSLLNIINDILDFSKIEAGKLDIELLEMDLRNCVEEVGSMLGFQAASKNLELIVNMHPGIPERVIGDPQRIRQCLTNLLGNAIKFTNKGEVVLEVSHLGDRDNKMLLHFEVRDSGIGLSAEAVAKLFQPFSQADSSTTRKFGGTGLGLSIVKRLIELMGGKVGVSSTLGEGSTFWFTLPLEVAVVPASAQAPGMTHACSKHILIVDDNRTNRQVLSRQLEHLGYEVSIADSGAAALRVLQQPRIGCQPIEVVLADFQMPDMDGAMLGARIKADPVFSQLRLVLLTSLDRQGDPQHFTNMGFAAYLTKPVRARELRDCLQQVLMQDSLVASGHHPVLLTRSALREQAAAERFIGKVLVVDDNIVNQKVASRFLERMGLEVVVANDGTNAVQLYESGSYAIVFMDLQMPLMDGYEATRRIRDAEAWRPRTAIIALTANAMSGQLERCLAVGMDGLLTKPIQIEQLRDTVARYCQRIHAATETHALDGATTAALLESPAQAHEVHLDIEQLRITADGDAGFMRELAQLYLHSSRQTLNDMHAALTLDDRTALCRNAHKLKGASAGIHARHLAQLCEGLEKITLEVGPEELARQLQKMEQSLENLSNELRQLIGKDQSAA